MTDSEIIELAGRPRPGTWGRSGSPGRRYVRTPEGAKKYGLPIGAPITADAIKRAQSRGRSYNVPEDDGDFGTQPPAAGRVRKDAKELVSAIRNSPPPKLTTPNGPKKVAVGRAGYGFPAGSRTFRPKDHQNFAIVRTPDYQLVVVTDKGVAFELDGELENELNEELDDNASLNFDADEPDAADASLQDVDGNGKTADTSAATGTTAAAPARVEDMPGFLDDEKLQGILDGMKAAGLDQAAMDTAELQLHRSNNRIRQEWAKAQAAQPATGANPDTDPNPDAVPTPDADPFETVAVPTPDRQRSQKDSGGSSNDNGDGKTDAVDTDAPSDGSEKPAREKTSSTGNDEVDKLISEIETEKDAQRAKDEEAKRPKSEDSGNKTPAKKTNPDDDLDALETMARGRVTGVAEGTVSGTKTRLRRNRVDDSIEYEVEDDEGNVTTASDRASAKKAATDAESARAAKAEAARPQRGQTVTLPDGRRGLVMENTDSGVRVHTGDRGELTVDEANVKIARSTDEDNEGSNLADEFDSDGQNGFAIQEYLDDDSADDATDAPEAPAPTRRARSAAAERRQAARKPRDTTNLTPAEMTDEEIDAALDDLNDFIRTTGRTPAVAKRRAAIHQEWRKRNPLIRENKRDTAAENDIAAPPQPATKDRSKISSEVWGSDGPRIDRAERQRLGIEAGQGEWTDKTVDRRSAIDARPGDKFVVKGGRSQQVYEVQDDGTVANLTLPDSMSKNDFADVIDDPNSDVYVFSGNKTNKTDRPSPQPGDIASDTWAKDAPEGAVAYSGDGVVQERKNGEWQTPMGPVDAESFAPSDVANDDSVVARPEATDDGRPVGATRQLLTLADEKTVKSGDGVTVQLPEGEVLHAVKKDDGSYDVTLPDGLVANVPGNSIVGTTGKVWHVPNRDHAASPSKSDWSVGDVLQNVDDIRAQKLGTKLRYRFLKPMRGKNESTYTVMPDGEIQHESGTLLPDSRIAGAIAKGQVSVAEIPSGDVRPSDLPEAPAPVTNPSRYKDGDKIADYRHLRGMKAGQTVTLVIPSHLNGGQEAKVTLTRTDDDKVMGGFMFLVGKRGRGYNSFGENNASIFQAIADGRLYFGDITGNEDDGAPGIIDGAWDTTPNIEAWKGGPMVSQADLQQFIASQVYSPAMQTSYFDMSRLPATNPFRQKAFRDQFADHAMKEYSEPGNPFRHKPASIRFAAEKLGLKFNDPGSALIPDDLDLADFKKKVTVGAWLRKDRSGKPLGKAAEENMGPEQIDVTAADLKTAFAAMDAMLERQDGTEDPDVILKRVFARQGSPLQDLNVAVAIASYYGMKRYRQNPDGTETQMTTIARQKDKRNNKALLRQMLQEQLEGREPGYYGLPSDETYTDKKGNRFVNRTSLSRPARNSDEPNPEPAPEQSPELAPDLDGTNAPGPSPDAQGPATPERLQELNDSLPETNAPEPEPAAAAPNTNAPSIYSLRADNPGTLYLEDGNGNIITPKTHRHVPADWSRPLVYDHAIDNRDRQDVFELDNSEQQAFIDVANRLSQGYRTYTAADLQGKRMYVNEDGTAAALLDGETIDSLELDVSQTPDVAERALKNISSALVARGARNAVLPDRTWWNDNMSQGGWRAVQHTVLPQGGSDLTYTLDPELIGQPAQRTTGNLPTGDRAAGLAAAKQWLDDYQKRDFHLAIDKGRAGDGHFKGTKLWGKYGASGLLMRHVDPNTGEERFMLVQRAGKNKNNPLYGKWQLPGGGLDSKETDAQGAARETIEEINPPAGVLGSLKAVGDNTFRDKSGWHYANLTADIPEQFTPTHLDPNEILDTKWLTRAEIAQMETNGELHPALSDSIRDTLATYGGNAASALPTQKPTNQPSIFGAKPKHGSINDADAKVVGGSMGGSNGGQVYELSMEDGTRDRFYVKKVRTVDQGKQEALASDLYRLAGARAPEADYSSADRAFYSRMMDLNNRGPANSQDLVREDFGADAWLANWDVRMGDNVMFDQNGNPVRLDNGGSMEYSATGRRKPFGTSVNEVDTLRQRGNIGANTFGARRAGQQDAWEAPSVQKVVNISDQDIRDAVTRHGLNQSLADTLIARRDDMARRYNLTPVAPNTPEPAAPEVPETNTPDVTPEAPATPTAAPVAGQRQKLDSIPTGAVPARGDAYRETLSDGTTRDVVVTQPKVPGHGTAAAVSSKLYQALGIRTADVSYDPNSNEATTSLTVQGPDAGAAGMADFRKGFVADAWLGNRAVGQQGKFVYDTNGNAVRIDNRGSLDMRLNGQKKPDFGDTVPELDSLRDPAINAGAASIYGTRQNGNFDDFEYDGAQAIRDLTDDQIRQIVSGAGGDSAMADRLIARRDAIGTYYGIVPTGQTLPGLNTRTIDSAPSLADARKAVGAAKARYVNATLRDGQSYLDTLKAAGNLDKAFENAWRARNPEKPDRIAGGKITNTVSIDSRTTTDDDIIDLAASFDFDPQLLADKAKEMRSSDRDPRVLHEVMAEQRGFHDTNTPVDPTQIDSLVSSGHRHVFRTVNNHSGMTGVQAADQYKQDGYWRRGNGAKAHGEGIYVSPTLSASMGYGHGNAGVIEMAFDERGSKIAPSSKFRPGSPRIQAIKARIQSRSDLTAEQKTMLSRVFSDQGTAAMALGYDALYGNAHSNDFNVLNKSKITFSDRAALQKGQIGNPYSASSADYRRAQIALQPTLQQSNNAQGNPAPSAGTANAAGISSGQVLQAIDLPKLGLGSVITVTRGGQNYTLRFTTRGWVNTATNRVQKWVDTAINGSPRGRLRFTVVVAN